MEGRGNGEAITTLTPRTSSRSALDAAASSFSSPDAMSLCAAVPLVAVALPLGWSRPPLRPKGGVLGGVNPRIMISGEPRPPPPAAGGELRRSAGEPPGGPFLADLGGVAHAGRSAPSDDVSRSAVKAGRSIMGNQLFEKGEPVCLSTTRHSARTRNCKALCETVNRETAN